VNRGDKRSRRYRYRDFAIQGSSGKWVQQHTNWQQTRDQGVGEGDRIRGGRGRHGGRDRDRDGHRRRDCSGDEGRHQGKEKKEKRGEGQCGATAETLRILYLNAQSIIKKVDELSCVSSTLKPDLILVTESWCNSDISDALLSIDGYEVQPDLRSDRQDTAQGRGGSLLVYVKTGLKVLKLDLESNFQQYFKFLIDDVVIYLLYRSPNAPPQSMTELEQLVRKAEKNSILLGDYNLPDIDWEVGSGAARSRAFLDAVEDSMMEQMVHFSTQVKGNCLDLVVPLTSACSTCQREKV
jgi:hypothetical protein